MAEENIRKQHVWKQYFMQFHLVPLVGADVTHFSLVNTKYPCLKKQYEANISGNLIAIFLFIIQFSIE